MDKAKHTKYISTKVLTYVLAFNTTLTHLRLTDAKGNAADTLYTALTKLNEPLTNDYLRPLTTSIQSKGSTEEIRTAILSQKVVKISLIFS